MPGGTVLGGAELAGLRDAVRHMLDVIFLAERAGRTRSLRSLVTAPPALRRRRPGRGGLAPPGARPPARRSTDGDAFLDLSFLAATAT